MPFNHSLTRGQTRSNSIANKSSQYRDVEWGEIQPPPQLVAVTMSWLLAGDFILWKKREPASTVLLLAFGIKGEYLSDSLPFHIQSCGSKGRVAKDESVQSGIWGEICPPVFGRGS